MFKFPITFRLLPLLVLVAFATACKKEDKKDDPAPPDTTKPVIQVQTPANNSRIAAGEVIRLSLVVTDDRELGELKIDLHDAFDGHSHGKNAGVFAFEKIIRLSGQRQEITENIQVPTDALAGPYHLILRATDRAGNQADFVEIDFSITSPSQPIIKSLKVNGSSSGHVHADIAAGKDHAHVDVEGEFEDTDGIKEVKLMLHEADHAHKRADHDAHLWEEKFEFANATRATIDAHFDLLAQWLKGKDEAEFELKVLVIDALGHRTERIVELHVERLK
jgi:hypothetical protein